MTLRLLDLTVRFPDGRLMFAPLTATVHPGQVLSVMAPSGAGKSSLLDAIGGHLAAGLCAQGQVWLNDHRVDQLPPEARRIGVMFQDAVLFPHLSLGDNLAFGLAPGVRGAPARRAAVEAALAQAGLSGMGARDPATLSGGQRTRAALMRALLAQPQALMLDEPFGALDAGLRADVRAFVFGHVRARAIPAIMVTHDASDAAAAGGPVLHLAPAMSLAQPGPQIGPQIGPQPG